MSAVWPTGSAAARRPCPSLCSGVWYPCACFMVHIIHFLHYLGGPGATKLYHSFCAASQRKVDPHSYLRSGEFQSAAAELSTCRVYDHKVVILAQLGEKARAPARSLKAHRRDCITSCPSAWPMQLAEVHATWTCSRHDILKCVTMETRMYIAGTLRAMSSKYWPQPQHHQRARQTHKRATHLDRARGARIATDGQRLPGLLEARSTNPPLRTLVC